MITRIVNLWKLHVLRTIEEKSKIVKIKYFRAFEWRTRT